MKTQASYICNYTIKQRGCRRPFKIYPVDPVPGLKDGDGEVYIFMIQQQSKNMYKTVLHAYNC